MKNPMDEPMYFKLPNLSVPEIRVPEFVPPPSISPLTNPNLASEFHKRLVDWISEFSNTLDVEHEVGVRLVSFGQTVIFHLEDISWWNPSLMKFIGKTDAGEPVELIQHVTQISILLMKLPRLDPNLPKKTIGFHVSSQTSEK